MKILIWLFSILNLGLGLRNLLNVVGILQTSKYAPQSTLLFGLLFLAMAGGALYMMLVREQVKPALWIAVGPWILALVVIVIQLMTGKYP
ncbi:MAG: hypothetical protein KDC19_08420 [Saprospiraceae bacterium]|nr:hypothetical protein [Saprospiraceae bacterium]